MSLVCCRRLLAPVLGLGLLAACTSTTSVDETGGAALSRPTVVVVQTFAVSPDQVKLDPGVRATVGSLVGSGNAKASRTTESDVGRQVADALADKLVVEIRDLGFEAERGSSLPPGTANGLLIDGQLVSVDEGNRTERVVVGFAAGRSDVRAHAQVYALDGSQRRLVDEIQVDAKSGPKPGMAETMGVGAVANRLLTATAVGVGVNAVSEEVGDNVLADADRAAKGIAKQLASLFARGDWSP
jgi:hypothetical protein